MSARLLRGKDVSDAVVEELRGRVATLSRPPSLAIVRVGEDPASVAYVRGKDRLAGRIGFRSHVHELPDATSQAELESTVRALNEDDDVDGILVQLPLPDHLDATRILVLIDPAKDVDGFHPVNVGRLWSGQPTLPPCTPAGLLRIMDHYELPIRSRNVVIIGRSNLVGKPAAALFLSRDATVTVAHSRSRDLPKIARDADILVSAVGRAAMITPDMVSPGAVVLDVGISRVDDKLRGDVHPDVADVASALTPMPGGTGLVTVAMLMQNTFTAAQARRGRD